MCKSVCIDGIVRYSQFTNSNKRNVDAWEKRERKNVKIFLRTEMGEENWRRKISERERVNGKNEKHIVKLDLCDQRISIWLPMDHCVEYSLFFIWGATKKKHNKKMKKKRKRNSFFLLIFFPLCPIRLTTEYSLSSEILFRTLSTRQVMRGFYLFRMIFHCKSKWIRKFDFIFSGKYLKENESLRNLHLISIHWFVVDEEEQVISHTHIDKMTSKWKFFF